MNTGELKGPGRELDDAIAHRQTAEDELRRLTDEEQEIQSQLSNYMERAADAISTGGTKVTGLNRLESRLNRVQTERRIAQEAVSKAHEHVKEAERKYWNLQRKRFNREYRERVNKLYAALLDAAKANKEVLKVYQQAQDELANRHDLVPVHWKELLLMDGRDSKLTHWIEEMSRHFEWDEGHDAQTINGNNSHGYYETHGERSSELHP